MKALCAFAQILPPWPKHNLCLSEIYFAISSVWHWTLGTIDSLKWKCDCVAILNNQISTKNTSENNFMRIYHGIFTVAYKRLLKKHIFIDISIHPGWHAVWNLLFMIRKCNKVFWGKSWHKDKPIFCWHLIPLLPALDLLCQCWRFDKKWRTQNIQQCGDFEIFVQRCLFTNSFSC